MRPSGVPGAFISDSGINSQLTVSCFFGFVSPVIHGETFQFSFSLGSLGPSLLLTRKEEGCGDGSAEQKCFIRLSCT